MNTTSSVMPSIAAIVHAQRGSADPVVLAFAKSLKEQGRAVHGLVQQRFDAQKSSTRLIDLQTGTAYPIYQNLGSGSASCALDSGLVVMASQVLRRALAEKADLAIANRFGELEAAGSGMAAEMLALMAAQVPFLTIVADDYLSAWRHSTGGIALELPAQREALDKWFAGLAG